MMLSLAAVEMDASIQCRAAIDTVVVGDYAERMRAGDEFPAIEVFGTKRQCWIADGWHRVLAARQVGATTIEARLHPGGRVDALKLALGANALHGQRRSNADKRRAVEIALREFPKLSSRAVAKLCGVDHKTVDAVRGPEGGEVPHVERTGQDGKQYPARRPTAPNTSEPSTPEVTVRERKKESVVLAPPSNGMHFARMAVMDLEQIRQDDAERAQALAFVREWIDAREA